MSGFLVVVGVLSLGMLVWDSVEVGRNDATNIVNAVRGARVLTRRTAVWIAGGFVVLGAAAASPVMETARKGIFDPTLFTLEQALTVYTAVYVVDTALLYAYSAFGMPVSTTASLVFELLGAAFALGGPAVVHWDKSGTVVFAIVASIIVSGAAGFLVQRMVRGAVRDRGQDLRMLLRHGGWIGGGMLAGLCYFMLIKGMKHVGWVKRLNHEVVEAYGLILVVLGMWVVFGWAIHLLLVSFGRRAASLLFPALAVVGMAAMGFAFGQNDLANCASPGLAALTLIQHRSEGVAIGTGVPIPFWALVACGGLLVWGMQTKYANRVTQAVVRTGSMAHHVGLWAPSWCLRAASFLLVLLRHRRESLAPVALESRGGKTMHYDAVRACVILSVSAIVIATASSSGLPVSTTYVAFAAVIATGMADRIQERGNAELKIGRTIWVVFSWFAAAGIAAVSAGVVARLIFHGGVAGIVIGLALNMTARYWFRKRADAQARRVEEEVYERVHPEEFALEREDE